jgi:hypothetical protein
MSLLPHIMLFDRGRPDHTAVVQAGMELGSWRPTEAQWSNWIQARSEVLDRQLPAWFVGTGGTSVFGLALVLASVSTSTGLTIATSCIVAPLVAFALVGLLRRLRSKTVLNRLKSLSAPRIVLTSTGVLVDDLARAWRATGYRLDHARMEGGDSPSLILRFRTSSTVAPYPAHTHALPVPPDVAKQGEQIVRELNRLATSRPI